VLRTRVTLQTVLNCKVFTLIDLFRVTLYHSHFSTQWRSEGGAGVRTASGGNLLGAANGQF